MTFNRLSKILADNQDLVTYISNVAKNEVELPYILDNIIKLLDDTSYENRTVSDNDIAVMAYMFKEYMSKCYADSDEIANSPKVVDGSMFTVYKIVASNGERFATKGEIDEGVEGLFEDKVYPAGEEEAKFLHLLYWTATGKTFAFRRAGFKLNYDKSGKVLNSFYEMIKMSYLQIKEMIDWVYSGDNFEKSVKRVKKFLKQGSYKYADYEKDEIKADMSVKQLFKGVQQHMPTGSSNVEYRKAWVIYLSAKNGRKVSPIQISELRGIYRRFCSADKIDKLTSKNTSLMEMCNRIERGVEEGKLSKTHFSLVIINTIKNGNYSRCSEKQSNILNDAIKIIEKNSKVAENTTNTDTATQRNCENTVITENGMEEFLNNFYDSVDDIFEEE